MLGSQAYVRAHKAELDNHVAFVTFDIGSGHTSGFYLNGREELREPIGAILGRYGRSRSERSPRRSHRRHRQFRLHDSGVPNLVALQDAAPYLPDYHAESDTFDFVNTKEARRNEAIAAALIWGLADMPDRIAARQSRSEIEKIVRDTKLEDQMKTFDQWDDFAAGRRGSPK